MIGEDALQMSYSQLAEKKEILKARLADLSSSGNDDNQILPGSMEVHWDHTMKEMVRF